MPCIGIRVTQIITAGGMGWNAGGGWGIWKSWGSEAFSHHGDDYKNWGMS